MKLAKGVCEWTDQQKLDWRNDAVNKGWSPHWAGHVLREMEANERSIHVPNTRPPRSLGMVELPWGRVSGVYPICMDNRDPATMVAGLRQRLVRVPPTPNRPVLLRFRSFVKDWVLRNIKPVEKMDLEEWLDSTNYNELRKKQLRDAYHECKGHPNHKQRRRIKTHVKREDYPEYKHARTINSRSDHFKVYSGPFFKPLENELYQHREFVKHMTPSERAKRIESMRGTNMHIYQSDFTAYESHFTREVQEACEMILYQHAFIKYPQDFTTLRRTLTGTNVLATRQGVRAKVSARRMSGEMNTSLGNGFTNFMLAKFLCAEKHAKCFDMVVEGDDAIICTDVVLTAADYAQLGFTIKLQEVKDIKNASFCGLIFANADEVIKDPLRFFQHFGWTESHLTAGFKYHMGLLHAKALSALHELPQCPIIGAAARYAVQYTAKYPAIFTDAYQKRLYDKEWVNVPLSPSYATRVLFHSLFHIDIDSQIQIERDLANGDTSSLARILIPHPHQSDYASRFVEEVST